MTYENTLAFAREMDAKDPLRNFREQFHFPERKGKRAIYFCGNSLGLQPRSVQKELEAELSSWRENGVEGHFSGTRPWVRYHEQERGVLAQITGAHPHEVVAMNNLTTNLHLMLASFYQPKGKRVKILIEGGAFPSDHYAVTSHMERMGVDAQAHLVVLRPRQGEIFSTQEITEAIDKIGNELALVLLPGIQYYTGQFFDLAAITRAAHAVGAWCGFDLAHAVGNVPLSLHADEVDFAVWCSYKYLNSGPGGVSGVFVHERHCNNPDFPKLKGWWGHHPDTRFQMNNQWQPAPGVESWMLSNTNVLSTAVHLASLKIFAEATMPALRQKSIQLTGFLEWLLMKNADLGDRITLLTPTDATARGCQLSLYIYDNGRQVFDYLVQNGVILDWREPNVIRVAPAPLYNTFEEVYQFVQLLKAAFA